MHFVNLLIKSRKKRSLFNASVFAQSNDGEHFVCGPLSPSDWYGGAAFLQIVLADQAESVKANDWQRLDTERSLEKLLIAIGCSSRSLLREVFGELDRKVALLAASRQVAHNSCLLELNEPLEHVVSCVGSHLSYAHTARLALDQRHHGELGRSVALWSRWPYIVVVHLDQDRSLDRAGG